jgi:membrane protease YdiL (CAAX protease family)
VSNSFGPFGDKPDEYQREHPTSDGYRGGQFGQPIQSDPYAPPLTETMDAEILYERRIGFPLVAWIVIILLSVGMFALQTLGGRKAKQVDTSSGFTLRMLEIQGKYIVAASGSVGMNREKAYKESKQLNQGPIDVRIRFVVLAGELAGADEALSQLDELQRKMEQRGKEPSESQARMMSHLESLYGDYKESDWDAPSLSDGDRQELKESLGWYGLLALGPKRGEEDDSMMSPDRKEALAAAQRVLMVMMVCILLGFAFGAAGFVGSVVFVVVTAMGKLRSHLDAGSCFGGVYAETFAIWMTLWIVLSIGVALLPFEFDGLLIGAIVTLATLVALFWPMIRGVPGRQLFREIGLIEQTGRRAWLEPFWGIVCYVCALPVLAIGFIVSAILMAAFAGGGGDEFSTPNSPSHPIVESIGDGAWLVWLKMFFVASIVAPIVEEIMFRGVLYRHLRDATVKWRVATSVLLSGGVSSLVFAIIHPQGIFGVPVLMSLAFTFCLAREWRGSLIAPITMHAINNGSVTLMLLILLSL